MTRGKSIHVCVTHFLADYFPSLACWVSRFWAGAYGKLIILSVQRPEFESESSFHYYYFFLCVGFYTCYTAVLWGSGCVCYFGLRKSRCRDAHCCCNQVSYSKQRCLVKLCLLDSTVAQGESQVASRTACVCCCLLCYGNTTSPLDG